MNIEITRTIDHCRADCIDLPGTPPVGVGRTPEMAVACLFYRMMFEQAGPDGSNWIGYIKKDQPIIVDGVLWEGPPFYVS